MKWGLWTLAGLASLGVAVWGAGQWRWSVKTRTLIDRLDAAREQAPAQRFDPDELRNLPEPVARYLRLVLPPGTPIVRAVELTHRGTFNMGQSAEQWRPFTSRQYVITRRPGFVWDGRVDMLPGLRVLVHDAYIAGEGILEPAIGGLFTLNKLIDRGEVARGELMRYFAEAAWYPTALLPSQGTQWEAIDDSRARATMVDGSLKLTMTFEFGSDGLIEAVRSDSRGRTLNGAIVMTPWEARVFDYQRRGGMLVPTAGEVAWLAPEGRMPYWRGSVTSIEYQY